MAESFHIYLSSEDSIETFPANTASNIRTQLPQELQLSEGVWWCALLNLQLPAVPPEPVYLCCDVCDESLVGEKKSRSLLT